MGVIQIGALASVLVAFSAHDLWDQTIPPWLCAAAAVGIGAGTALGPLEWWWSSAAVGLAIFVVAGLPIGDRAGVAIAVGLLPLDLAMLALVWAITAGLTYVYLVGRFRSMIGVPFFPAVSAAILMVVLLEKLGHL